jgi:hypothetical protein
MTLLLTIFFFFFLLRELKIIMQRAATTRYVLLTENLGKHKKVVMMYKFFHIFDNYCPNSIYDEIDPIFALVWMRLRSWGLTTPVYNKLRDGKRTLSILMASTP